LAAPSLAAVFNFAIAFGALLGSFVVDSIALTGVLWITAGLAALTSFAVWSGRDGKKLKLIRQETRT